MFKIAEPAGKVGSKCTHCGDECPPVHPIQEQMHFCCNGCEVVYNLLTENGMEAYYVFEDKPGISRRSKIQKSYDFLEDAEVVNKLIEFRENNICKISLQLPQIHCASCIWLLENLNRLNEGVLTSRINFLKKEATITFDIEKVTLRSLVELLAAIGYEPELNFHKLGEKPSSLQDRTLLYKLGLAGFSFGNIMLLSFPEYLGFAETDFRFYLGYINIALAIPVLLYSGRDYLRAAYWTLKMRSINIDIPIAVGMLTLFFRSSYEIISQTGEGYLDSLAGFVFFLLIGKWFQHYTFQSISFDRDFRSYFPISANLKSKEGWKSVSLDRLKPGDIILIRNEEIIPADGLMLKGLAKIDYSFVTGEAEAIVKSEGDKIFAGGKQTGGNIEINLIKNVDQSYLTKLWDDDSFKLDKEASTQTLINTVGKYFTLTIMAIAILTLIFWLINDKSLAFNSFTAVLIVACPCALALAIPFTYGNILRILSKRSFFIKNVQTIERFQQIDHIVFDKTGTITDNQLMSVSLNEGDLTAENYVLIKSAVSQSNHPISKAIYDYLGCTSSSECLSFKEITGQGIIAEIDHKFVRIGSSSFIFGDDQAEKSKGVFIEIDGKYVAKFSVETQLRKGVKELVSVLGTRFPISIISGDTDIERERLKTVFPKGTDMRFNQSPGDKLQYIKDLQVNGKKIMMVGDGLNDAGALKQSEVGLVISDTTNNFTPACDAIIGASEFNSLLKIILFLRKSKYLIYGAFILALLYNTIGLFFAVNAKLSPVIAAILMPLSSVSVMIFGVLASFGLFKYIMRN